MKKAILFFTVVFILGCSNSDNHITPLDPPRSEDLITFTSLGLSGKIVNQLLMNNAKLYAATDQGLFVSDFSSNWSLLGFENENIESFVFLKDDIILCSMADHLDQVFKIFKSENSGMTWEELEDNFGGELSEPISSFTYHKDTNELIAIGRDVVANSFDEGLTWEPFYGDWQAFAAGLSIVKINPHNKELWSGGQNAIEGLKILHFTPERKLISQWGSLIPSPSVCKAIAFNPLSTEEILIGAESGILRTTNNGITWKNIHEDHDSWFYFGLDYDKRKPTRIIAASWQKILNEPQPLIVHISENNGKSWNEYSPKNQENLFGGVFDMIQREENNNTILYLGLYKGEFIKP